MSESETEEMTTLYSPRKTRSQTPASGSETDPQRAILLELEQNRKERRLEQERMRKEMEERDAEIQQLRGQIIELSRSNISFNLNECNVRRNEIGNNALDRIGYKLKPDIFDGSGSLREYFIHFDLIARANCWTQNDKVLILASCLRGKARSVLECISNIETLKFEELKSKLELRFGEGQLSQAFYTQFTSRKQKFGEEISALGSDIERLSRLAYPECDSEIREKIACAQFINALSDGFIRRTLQIEGLTSLKLALERAKTLKIIQENNSFRKDLREKDFYKSKQDNERFNNKRYNREEGETEREKKNYKFNKPKTNFNFKANDQERKFEKECWQCGKKGHFRFDCPTLRKENAN